MIIIINKNINYKDLSEYIKLAISQYEDNNNTSIEGYSFEDLIDWLEHFEQMKANKETVTISIEEYESLLDNEKLLEALEIYGVDNWPGYEDACKSIQYEE